MGIWDKRGWERRIPSARASPCISDGILERFGIVEGRIPNPTPTPNPGLVPTKSRGATAQKILDAMEGGNFPFAHSRGHHWLWIDGNNFP